MIFGGVEWRKTVFDIVTNKLHAPTVVPTDDVELDALGVVPLLALSFMPRACS